MLTLGAGDPERGLDCPSATVVPGGALHPCVRLQGTKKEGVDPPRDVGEGFLFTPSNTSSSSFSASRFGRLPVFLILLLTSEEVGRTRSRPLTVTAFVQNKMH